jgi:hypothetical protein
MMTATSSSATVCGGCGEQIFRDSAGAWSILAWASTQPMYECRPPGYAYEYGTLFHAPDSA